MLPNLSGTAGEFLYPNKTHTKKLMKKTSVKLLNTKPSFRLAGGALVAAIVSGVYAQEKPYSQAGPAQPVPPPPGTSASAPAIPKTDEKVVCPAEEFFQSK